VVVTVNIAPNQPLVANPGDPPTIILGQAAHLDGSNSSPSPPGIDSYTWNFGDGTSASGPVQDHVYPGPAPKTWTATLTIAGGGSTASATVNVTVLPASSAAGLTINVTGDGAPLSGASVVVEDANNKIFNGTDKGGGVYNINGLPDGTYTVFGYKGGFVPNTASATISGGTGSTTLALASGAVATTTLTATRLTAAQAVALGIDPTAPGNQNIYQFELHLAFIPGAPLSFSGVATGSGFYGVGGAGGAGGCSIFCSTIFASGGGFTVIGNVAEAGGDNPTIIWMIIPGKAQWLKEMFDVRILVTNLAPTPFTLSQGSATLNLTTGLSLAQLQPGLPAQQLTKPISDIPGQTSQGTDWLIRGDTEGFYQLTADYRAVLNPVGAPIQLHAQTADPIHIWGASALRMTFDADAVAYAAYPYHIKVSLTNVSDVPVFNPLVELRPLETDPNRNYIFQPGEQYDQSTDEILPGATFQTRDYIVAPNFNGTLDLSRSFVAPVGGNISALSSAITSHMAPPPSSYPADSALIESDGVLVSWQAVPGAKGYQVFITPDYPKDFPSTPAAQVNSSATGVTLPPGTTSLIAISTLLPGADGELHNVLSHPLVRPHQPALAPNENPAAGNGSEPGVCYAQGAGVDPCNTASGDFFETYYDITIPGRGMALDLTRTYSSLSPISDGPFGYGWTASYNISLKQDTSGNVTISQENGAVVSFFRQPDGTFGAPPRVDATLVHNSDGSWTFTRRARLTFTFNANGAVVHEVDANGYATAFSYNSQGQLGRVTDPAGRSLAFAYSGSHVATVTDPIGRVFHYSYDTSGNLTDVTDPAGGNTHFAYDSGHRMLTVRRPNQAPGVAGSTSAVLTNTYDNAGRLVQQSDQLGRTTSFAYSGDNFSPLGGTTTITDPKGNETLDRYVNGLRLSETRGYGTALAATWTYSYDPATLDMISTTDPDGHSSTATYDTAGNLLTRTDALGRKTTNTYDALHDLLTTTDPSGVTTTMTYNGRGNLLSTSRPLAGTSQVQVTTNIYGDSAHPGDITAVSDPGGGVSRFTYDSAGDVIATTDQLGEKTTDSYNAIGWRLSVISPKGNGAGAKALSFTTRYTYDAMGRVLKTTDPLGDAITNAFDLDGNVIASTDADGHKTMYTYDAADEATAINRPDGSKSSTTYWQDGKVKDQIDGTGAVTHYEYDALGRIVSTTDPLGRMTRYSYDSLGNETSMMDPSGRITTMTYDAGNQLLSITYSDAATPKVTNITYDGDGQRTGLKDGTGSWSWTWDSLHRVTRIAEGANGSVAYTYDSRNLITSITYPNGLTATYAYDAVGRLISVTDWLGNVTNFGYDSDSNMTVEQLPAATGVVDTQKFDNADRIINISDTSAGVAIFSAKYKLDANGLVTRDGSAPGTSHAYAYTAANQLCYAGSKATSPCASPPSHSIDYSYGPSGNLLEYSGTTQSFDVAGELCWTAATAGVSGTCSSPPANAAIYSYDSQGDRTGVGSTAGPTTTFGYDQAGRLSSYTAGTTTATYTYNADGLRMSKTSNGKTTSFVWDQVGGAPRLLIDGSTSYIYGPGGLPIEEINGTAVWWLHHDRLGSTRLVTDSVGSAVGTYTFDPYGRLLQSSGAIVTPLLYCGQYRDAESGLYYLRAREYDPGTGQFISRDPVAGLTLEPYSYAHDSPANFVDPSGLWGISGCFWVCLAYDTDAGFGVGVGTPGVGIGFGPASFGPSLDTHLVPSASAIAYFNPATGQGTVQTSECLSVAFAGLCANQTPITCNLQTLRDWLRPASEVCQGFWQQSSADQGPYCTSIVLPSLPSNVSLGAPTTTGRNETPVQLLQVPSATSAAIGPSSSAVGSPTATQLLQTP
jgi:RHS repeat-associated protein